MRKLWQTNKVKMGEETIKLMKSRTQKGGFTLNTYKGEEGESKKISHKIRIY